MFQRPLCAYASSPWETALQCNAVSHWLGTYTERSLIFGVSIVSILEKSECVKTRPHNTPWNWNSSFLAKLSTLAALGELTTLSAAIDENFVKIAFSCLSYHAYCGAMLLGTRLVPPANLQFVKWFIQENNRKQIFAWLTGGMKCPGLWVLCIDFYYIVNITKIYFVITVYVCKLDCNLV